MDKNAIKKYAVWARRELIARVSQKAEQYGITEKEIIDERAENIHGVVLTPAQKSQRQALIHLIRRDGYQQAMEEVAYTWFNRFIALRFMEVNDYLPGHTRAFTDEQNVFKPKIMSDALNLELNGLNLDKVIELKETNKTEELYQYLLITLCNHLSAILPGMFQRIDDYTELLFPEHLLREGSVLEQLVTMIPQEDWLDAVQIIGWLYQYYNAEPKDQVFANLKKNIKISKKDIPAATQLFTPDWIVRYMVENSLGRLWVEGHPNDSLKAGWKYYLEEAEQETEVQAQLQEIRSEYAQMNPEDILCIDPCSGSGHILVYLFDVLVQIYEAYGYPTRDAVASIVSNNLWGLDIDDRAAQLAYFAVMMKARQYDKGWFRRGIEPHIYAIKESNGITSAPLHDMGINLSQEDYTKSVRQIMQLIEDFHDAKEYGSIIQPAEADWDLLRLFAVPRWESIGQQIPMNIHGEVEAAPRLQALINLGQALSQKYHVVVTNPPYMGSSGMGDKLAKFVKDHYPDTKSDMSTVMMERCLTMCNDDGLMSMINIPVWMFLSSYEKLRRTILKDNTYINMVHPGRGIFGSDFGTTAFVIGKKNISGYESKYRRLFDKQGEVETNEVRESQFLSGKGAFTSRQDSFVKIPGAPIAYWIGNSVREVFKSKPLSEIGESFQGIITGNVDKHLRLWYEIAYKDIVFHESDSSRLLSTEAYYPYLKGGEFRKWYGNLLYVIKWKNNGADLVRSRTENRRLFFKPGISWSLITISDMSFRTFENGFLCDVAGSCYIPNEINQLPYIAAMLNSKVSSLLLNIINPTVNLNIRDVLLIPIIIDNSSSVVSCATDAINLSKEDWDSFETSWDFQVHPIVRWIRDRHNAQAILPLFDQYNKWKQANPEKALENDLQVEASSTVELSFNLWRLESFLRFQHLKANEEELNRIFIDIYGLQDELTPEVSDKDVTVRQADLGRDIRSLVSCAVGCMLGRYSLDKPGLVFAGGEWDEAQYVTYPADKDGVLPITDDDYFSDDVVSMFVDWVKTVFGPNELEDNLKFIATALYPNGGGTARELIRQYFLNDFYKDHLKIYQKRPIYWMFDAGKKNSFKCLIYLHRYRPDTVARVRTDYVHEMQARYRTAMEDLAHRVETASGSERVRLQKQLVKIQGQEEELRKYEEKIHHYADMMLPLDLDDGVKVNYAKLQDVLAPIK